MSTRVPTPPLQTLPGGMLLWIGQKESGKQEGFCSGSRLGLWKGITSQAVPPPRAGEPQQHGDGSSGLFLTPMPPPKAWMGCRGPHVPGGSGESGARWPRA